MKAMSKYFSVKSILIIILLSTIQGISNAADTPLVRSINLSIDNNLQESALQKRVEQLDDSTRIMLEEYQSVSRELDSLTLYNQQLNRMVSSQQAEKISIQQQMVGLQQTRQEIIPLMMRMVQWMQKFLIVDQPFLITERHRRIELLQGFLDRSDISLGEKYRRVLEAYQIEMEYGRTIEAFRTELKTANLPRTVDVLRVGRLGLYYQTLDRAEVGFWNSSAGEWQVLSDDYKQTIRKALKIARKQAAPELLNLPVPTPVEAKL